MCVVVVVLLICASSDNGAMTRPDATVTICRLRPAVSVAGWEYNVFTDLSLVDCAFAKNGVLSREISVYRLPYSRGGASSLYGRQLPFLRFVLTSEVCRWLPLRYIKTVSLRLALHCTKSSGAQLCHKELIQRYDTYPSPRRACRDHSLQETDSVLPAIPS